MGGRSNTAERGSGLIGGKNDPEITDDIRDFFLPRGVRNKLSQIEKIQSCNKLKSYLESKGIELDTDLQSLKGNRANDNIPAVTELAQKIAVGIETYQELYGPKALSSLKKVVLYDQNLDTHAAYHFNLIGEKDLLAGTIRFSDWNASGRDVFHELGHAFQDSNKAKGEDVISYSDRIAQTVGIPKSAYTGSSGIGEENAERMAEAFGFGFSRGSKSGVRFIENLSKSRRKR